MSEQKPDELNLHLPDGSEQLMTRHNSRLYTFFGNLATRNHVFIVKEEREESSIGAYIFAHSDAYQPIVSFMLTHQFPMSINNVEVAQCDEDAFQRSLDQLSESAGDNVPDEIPDWMEDGQA